MGKFFCIVTLMTAFLVALFVVLTRRSRRTARPPTSRFGLLVASFAALLTGTTQAVRADAPKPADVPAGTADAEKALAEQGRTIRGRTEWAKIKESWLGVTKLSSQYSNMSKVIAEKKAEAGKLLDALVAARLVSREGANVFNAIYGDRVFHQLRAHSGATCYDPTDLGWKQQLIRENLEQRLAVLEKVKVKGSLKKEVVAKLDWTLKKQMEVTLRIEALWEKQPKGNQNWDKYRKAEDEIRALLGKHDYKSHTVEIKDSVKVRSGIEEAVRLIRLIYEG